ncbi:MAG: response regulator [Pelosinus sp.]|nr:response regulator [Pelosinus sp.]
MNKVVSLNIKLLSVKFAEEAAKHCNLIEKDLLVLEAEGFSKETIDAVFRAAHTIKGAARMLKLTAISEVAHRMEDVFEELREKESSLSKEMIDILLQGIDTIRALLALVAAGESLPEALPAICAQLEEVLCKNVKAKQYIVPTSKVEVCAPKSEEAVQPDFVQIRAERLDELIGLMGELISYQYRKQQQVHSVRDIMHLAEGALELSYSIAPDKEAALQTRLADMHSQLKKLQDLLRNDAARESQITKDLQQQSLKVRMLPITTIFDSINRVVRDFARTAGKEIEFEMTGGETELDRKIIDELRVCLLHMIRNAVDHGIELSKERIAAGKPPRGIIRLAAFYDAGGVTLMLEDDGAGISLDDIKSTALKKRFYSQETINKLTERELLDLIFLPGFSTSPIITDISGRGVGMNVVKETIAEKLKGSLAIKTRQGKGTAFTIKVPITLALSRMLTVAAGNETFAFPAYAVQEVLKAGPDQVIDVAHKRAVRVREQIIPLEELAVILGCPHAAEQSRQEFFIIVLAAGAEKCGLVVDAVLSEMDMVIKPVPSVLKQPKVISGFTVGSNDEIISVLGAQALIKKTRENRQGMASIVKAATGTEEKTILVVDDSVNTRDIVKSILESYGYTVDLAEDGLAAIEKTGKKVYDAVITDIEMPCLDGFSLTSHLRQDERYRQIPIIIVTSREKAEDKRRGILVGASAYIVKGAFDQNNLIETLQNVIG